MELKQKGSEANISDAIKALKASLRWTGKADLDLGAAYKKNDESWGFVYFGGKGDLNSMPFMKLDKDAGIGDTLDSSGVNEENMVITKFEGKKMIKLLAWDYNAVLKGEPSRFKEANASIKLLDDTGIDHQVTLDTSETGNITCIADIEISPVGAKVVNSSTVQTIKGFDWSNISAAFELR